MDLFLGAGAVSGTRIVCKMPIHTIPGMNAEALPLVDREAGSGSFFLDSTVGKPLSASYKQTNRGSICFLHNRTVYTADSCWR